MDGEERERLGAEVDALVAGLDEERARHQAGLSADPSLVRLFEAHREAADLQTARRLTQAGEVELGRRVAGLVAERVAAPHEEAWRSAEARLVVDGPAGRESLCDAERGLPREAERGRRAALAAAVEAALEGVARHREAAAEARAGARAAAGLVPDWAAVVEGDQLLSACDDGFADLLAFARRGDEELAPLRGRDLARHDLLRLVAFPALGIFRAVALESAVRATLRDLALAPVLAKGRVRVERSDRPLAWPGAHATGPRLSFRAGGGLPDWPALLEGLGRALAAAPGRPATRQPELAAALGRLLGGLCLEPRWLALHLGVERRAAADLVRAMGLRELTRRRAEAAALRVATEVERGLSGRAWREGHRAGLTAALHATWEGVRASRDDEASRLATSLRGFAEGERLHEELRERFDEDFWRNPRTGEHLAGLLAAGRLPDREPASPSGAAARLCLTLERGGAIV
jgi:hypothetical protein